MSNETGLEARYKVKKINDPEGKHDDCFYFVLDPKHDPMAAKALRYYGSLARDARMYELANDIHDLTERLHREP